MTGALVQGEADVAIASMAISAQAREVLDFTLPVYQTPGRFVVRLGEAVPDRFVPETLAGRPVGVAAGSAHQAFLEKFFPRTPLRAYPTLAALYSALKREEVPIIFADGIASAIWLASADPQDCCAMAPGAWSHSAFFGEGAGIAMAKGRPALRQALNYALQRLAVRRVWSEIYLKYFPVGFY
jgi:polar amino acid transport system substrate-binding protein